MKVAIVDDEVHCIESLVINLNKLFPEIDISYKTNSPKDALHKLPQIKPDLLFLDVEMPGMNGFELLEQLSDQSFGIIFTTAYNQYALKALKAKAIDYLLKPVDEQELKEAVQRWKTTKELKKDTSSKMVDELLDYLKQEGILKSKIAVSVSDGIEFVAVHDIMYCNSQGNYTCMYLSDGSKTLLSKSLKEIEKTLAQYFFLRVHQSYLINPDYMKKYFRGDGGYVIMKDEKSIPVSKPNKGLVTGLFDSIKNRNDAS